jgi:hypothetical protein
MLYIVEPNMRQCIVYLNTAVWNAYVPLALKRPRGAQTVKQGTQVAYDSATWAVTRQSQTCTGACQRPAFQSALQKELQQHLGTCKGEHSLMQGLSGCRSSVPASGCCACLLDSS